MENKSFLTDQIITYIGNKRKLLPQIEEEVIKIKEKLGKEKISCVDLFSGSGIVARMLKQHSSTLYTNDMEEYSFLINECYLTNRETFDEEKYLRYYELIRDEVENLIDGVISNNYAPKDENNITKEDRVFYTKKNAQIIDTVRKAIDTYVDDESYKKYFIAPLLYEASVHCNTSGVFKGFYKDKETGIGKYGGNGENALQRIKGEITIQKPIFSNYSCDVSNYKMDSNILVKELPETDIIYIDPPYNQHPYGSNYFMLNTIIKNELGKDVSKVSGIPKGWNKSKYNKKKEIKEAFTELIKGCKAKYLIISYNSEGFLTKDELFRILTKRGKTTCKEIVYPTFRGSRNLRNRNITVNEYLFVVECF